MSFGNVNCRVDDREILVQVAQRFGAPRHDLDVRGHRDAVAPAGAGALDLGAVGRHQRCVGQRIAAAGAIIVAHLGGRAGLARAIVVGDAGECAQAGPDAGADQRSGTVIPVGEAAGQRTGQAANQRADARIARAGCGTCTTGRPRLCTAGKREDAERADSGNCVGGGKRAGPARRALTITPQATGDAHPLSPRRSRLASDVSAPSTARRSGVAMPAHCSGRTAAPNWQL